MKANRPPTISSALLSLFFVCFVSFVSFVVKIIVCGWARSGRLQRSDRSHAPAWERLLTVGGRIGGVANLQLGDGGFRVGDAGFHLAH